MEKIDNQDLKPQRNVKVSLNEAERKLLEIVREVDNCEIRVTVKKGTPEFVELIKDRA